MSSDSPSIPDAFHAYEGPPPDDKHQTVRFGLENELRERMTTNYRDVSGVPDVELHYAVRPYAKATVIRDQCQLVGWPSDVKYVSFNNIRGGNKTLRRLIALCDVRDETRIRFERDETRIRFERATPEDVANAKRDPRTVHPDRNYRRPGAEKANQTIPVSVPSLPTIVPVIVLHPDDLSFVGVHPTCTQPSAAAAALGGRPRRQRRDLKQPRHRDLTGPYNRPHILPKEGIKSEPSILASASDPAEDARPVSDPLPEFLSVCEWGAQTFAYGQSGDWLAQLGGNLLGSMEFGGSGEEFWGLAGWD